MTNSAAYISEITLYTLRFFVSVTLHIVQLNSLHSFVMSLHQCDVEVYQSLTHVRLNVHKLTGHVSQHGQAVCVQVSVLCMSHVVLHSFDNDENEQITCKQEIVRIRFFYISLYYNLLPFGTINKIKYETIRMYCTDVRRLATSFQLTTFDHNQPTISQYKYIMLYRNEYYCPFHSNDMNLASLCNGRFEVVGC